MSTSSIRDMFSALVPEYDQFNRLSSLGLDGSWRREVAKLFSAGSTVLDVGTGTGDLALEIMSHGVNVVGVDFSEAMIQMAREKCSESAHGRFQVASAERLPFDPNSFDGLTSAFVIRNLHHGGVLIQSLREFYRVLKPGAQMAHLELTQPPKGIMSIGYRAYMRAVLPSIGRMVFGSRWPKNYLKNTIEKFPPALTVCQWMRWSGFDRVCHYPLSRGIASLFVGTKPHD